MGNHTQKNGKAQRKSADEKWKDIIWTEKRRKTIIEIKIHLRTQGRMDTAENKIEKNAKWNKRK